MSCKEGVFAVLDFYIEPIPPENVEQVEPEIVEIEDDIIEVPVPDQNNEEIQIVHDSHEELLHNVISELIEYPDLEVSDSIKKVIKPCSVTIHNSGDLNDIFSCKLCRSYKKPWRKKTFFQCELCFSVFKNENALNNHKETDHSSNFSFKCDYCSKEFSDSLRLRNHTWTEHLQESSLSHSRNNLTNSTNNSVEEKCFECPHCLQNYISYFDFKNHTTGMGKNKCFECKFCKKLFPCKSLSDFHECELTVSEFYQCDLCSKVFAESYLFKQHEIAHRKNMYDCDICGKIFNYKSDVAYHKQVHSDDKPFECNLCPKKFSRKNGLKIHLYEHFGVTKYACLLCNKNFYYESQYKLHLVSGLHKKTLKRTQAMADVGQTVDSDEGDEDEDTDTADE